MPISIDEIFTKAATLNASDVHLVVGKSPMMRKDGMLVPIPLADSPLTSKDIESLCYGMLSDSQKGELEREKELDFSYHIENIGRFRVNLHWERRSLGLVARVILGNIPTMQDIDMPSVGYNLARLTHGLILVTGPAGCGKSTTLAAMLNLINTERNAHIITLEDPIEFVYEHKKSIVKQRELGTDFISFHTALKHVLRQDPSVLLVGEMRDLETTAATLTLAETGHLVMTTLHTFDAAQTIDRIIDIFPPFQQNQIRLQLSLSLRGIITQKLIPKIGGGQVAAREILINTPAVANLIRENKITQIHTVLQTSAKEGMQPMDSAIRDLFKRGLIDEKTALTHVQNRTYV